MSLMPRPTSGRISGPAELRYSSGDIPYGIWNSRLKVCDEATKASGDPQRAALGWWAQLRTLVNPAADLCKTQQCALSPTLSPLALAIASFLPAGENMNLIVMTHPQTPAWVLRRIEKTNKKSFLNRELLLCNPSLPPDVLAGMKGSVNKYLWVGHPNLPISLLKESFDNFTENFHTGLSIGVLALDLMALLQNPKLSLDALEQVTEMIVSEIARHGKGPYVSTRMGKFLAHIATHQHVTAGLLDRVRHIVKQDLSGETWRHLMMTIEPIERDTLMQDVVWIDTGRYIAEQGHMTTGTSTFKKNEQEKRDIEQTWSRLVSEIVNLPEGTTRETALLNWLRVAPEALRFYTQIEKTVSLNLRKPIPVDILRSMLLSNTKGVRELALLLLKSYAAKTEGSRDEEILSPRLSSGHNIQDGTLPLSPLNALPQDPVNALETSHSLPQIKVKETPTPTRQI